MYPAPEHFNVASFDLPLRWAVHKHCSDAESVCDTLMLAEMTHSPHLAELCKAFFCAHAEAVLATRGYAALCQRPDRANFLQMLSTRHSSEKRPRVEAPYGCVRISSAMRASDR